MPDRRSVIAHLRQAHRFMGVRFNDDSSLEWLLWTHRQNAHDKWGTSAIGAAFPHRVTDFSLRRNRLGLYLTRDERTTRRAPSE